MLFNIKFVFPSPIFLKLYSYVVYSEVVLWSALAAITKYHRLGALNTEIYFSTVLEATRQRSRFS